MFTEHLDLISQLKSKIPAFAYLYNKYEKLEQEIGVESICPNCNAS